VQVIGKQLRGYGYSGGWRDSRWGGAALWFKELGSLAAVKADEARIPAYDVPAWIRDWKRPSNKGVQLTRSALANGRREPRS
jgi:hypothetical protein